jgi:hypothetical protein
MSISTPKDTFSLEHLNPGLSGNGFKVVDQAVQPLEGLGRLGRLFQIEGLLFFSLAEGPLGG